MAKKFYIITKTQRRMPLKFPDPDVLPKVDLDFELSLNNSPIAMEVILNGLIRGNATARKRILSKLRKLSSWPLFDTYLASSLMQSLKKDINLEITDQYIFNKVSTYGPEIYNELLTRRDVRGILANLAQALYLRPKLRHIGKAIKIVQKHVEREKKEGFDYRTIMHKYLPDRRRSR